MKKNIKYATSFTILTLSLMFGFLAQANDNTTEREKPVACTMEAKLCPDGVTTVGRVGPKCEFQVCPGEKRGEDLKNKFENFKKENELNKKDFQIKREEFGEKKKEVKKDFEIERGQQKVKIDAMIQSVKTQREEFKKEFEGKKEEVKIKVEEMRNRFKEDLNKIKDEKKKVSAAKILEIIQELNIKSTNKLSEKVDKIENVLVSIESRISKAEEKGIDVSSLKNGVEKARISIDVARKSISVQSEKVYEVNITTEATLRADMKKLRDLFRADMKNVYEKVKLAHEAVKSVAQTLAKIPKIDDDNDEINNIKKEDISVTSTTSATTNN